ncbi:MAG: tetratricopeptide repeat protein [Deltaproteobacteria bacterium]|nr:tetratricopeptide repeat protein [Deltaproteobacteria bacterium]
MRFLLGAGVLAAWAWTLGSGLALRLVMDGVGAAPWAQVASLGMIGAGLASARGAGWRASRRGDRLPLPIGATVALWLSPILAGLSPTLAILGAAAALFALGVGLSRACPQGPGAIGALTAAPLVWVGLNHPLTAALITLGLLALLDTRPEPERSAFERSKGPGLTQTMGDAVIVAAGAAILIGGWSASRAYLDPTPSGLAAAAGGALVAMALGTLWPKRSLGAVAPWVGLAALVTLVAVIALPSRGLGQLAVFAGGDEDPRLTLTILLALIGAPGGFAIGRAVKGGSAGILVSLAGLWGARLGLNAGPDTFDHALLLAGGLGLVGIIGGGKLSPRLLGGLAFAGALGALLWPLPWPEQLLLSSPAQHLRAADGLARAKDAQRGLTAEAGGFGPNGATLVWSRRGALAVSVIDGAEVPAEGREADVERLVAALGAGLTLSLDHAVVLGETRGLTVAGLNRQGVAQITVAVPDPDSLRARAALDPALAEAMLSPNVQLHHQPTELLLREAPKAELIIELSRLPWRDAAQGLPSDRQLRLRRSRLSDDGVYALVVPITWMDEASLGGLALAFAETFPQAMAFMPSTGADHLILVGFASRRLTPWPRLVQAVALGGDELAAVQVRSAVELADRALTDSAGLRALGQRGARPSPYALPAGLNRRPRMLLPLFVGRIITPETWLDLSAEPQRKDELAARAEGTRRLLELLDDASRGDMEDVFEQSRALLDAPGGARALDPLVAPMLARAREALAEGVAEGPQSRAWSRCLSEVESARLINPRAAEAFTLAGRCRLATGDNRRAAEEFEGALALDPADLDALLGIAQVHASRGALNEAEARLREATRTNPRAWRSWYHLGALMLDLGRLDDADRALSQARALAGETSGLPAGAMADLALQRGDPNAALVHAERAVSLQPVAKHLHLRALCYLELGQESQAERDLRAAIYEDPDWWPAHGDLGRVFAARGEYAQAIDAFKRALTLKPDNAPAAQNLRLAERRLAEERRATTPPPR